MNPFKAQITQNCNLGPHLIHCISMKCEYYSKPGTRPNSLSIRVSCRLFCGHICIRVRRDGRCMPAPVVPSPRKPNCHFVPGPMKHCSRLIAFMTDKHHNYQDPPYKLREPRLSVSVSADRERVIDIRREEDIASPSRQSSESSRGEHVSIEMLSPVKAARLDL